MAKSSAKKLRNLNQNNVFPLGVGFEAIKPLNYIQAQYLKAIHKNNIIFGIGSAGTGKTYIAATFAASELFHRRIKKIVLTRPNVEAGRKLGFLPGTLEEKYFPYLEPFDQIFIDSLGRGFYEYAINKNIIIPKPLGFMRGLTFDDCIVLLDEAQNASKDEIKMLLSRIGKNCKIIISGDNNQSDISNSGLLDATQRLQHIEGIEVIKFCEDDIIRSNLCKQIILAYK